RRLAFLLPAGMRVAGVGVDGHDVGAVVERLAGGGVAELVAGWGDVDEAVGALVPAVDVDVAVLDDVTEVSDRGVQHARRRPEAIQPRLAGIDGLLRVEAHGDPGGPRFAAQRGRREGRRRADVGPAV